MWVTPKVFSQPGLSRQEESRRAGRMFGELAASEERMVDQSAVPGGVAGVDRRGEITIMVEALGANRTLEMLAEGVWRAGTITINKGADSHNR